MKVQSPSESTKIVYDFGQPDASGEYTSLDVSLQHTGTTPTPYNKAAGAVKIVPTTSRTNKGVQRAHLIVRVPLPLVAQAASCGCGGDSGKRAPVGFAQMAIDLTLPNAEGVLADTTTEIDENGQPLTVRAANLLAANMARNILLGLILNGAGSSAMGEVPEGGLTAATLNFPGPAATAKLSIDSIVADPLYRGVSGVAPVDPAATYVPKYTEA